MRSSGFGKGGRESTSDVDIDVIMLRVDVDELRMDQDSELLDRALLLIEKNYALPGGGLAEEGDESGPGLDFEPLMDQGSSNHQQLGIPQVTQIPSEIAEEKKDTEEEEDGRGGGGSINSISYTVTEVKTQREEKLQAGHVEEIEVEGVVGGDVSDFFEMETENQSGGRSRNDDDRSVGGGRGSLVEIMSGGGRVTPSSEPPDLGVPKAEVDSSSLELPPSAPPGHCPCLAAVKLVFVKVGMEELPPDRSVYIEAGGTLVAAASGSSPAVVKPSSPSMVEMTIACEREKGARAAMEEVGQNFDLMGQAQKCSIKRISDARVRSHMRHNTGPQQVLKNKTMGQLNEEKMWALEEGENLTITDANNVELRAGRGAAGENIHIQLSSSIEINYEMYARFSRLLSLDSWAYLYANKTRSTTSVFFMPYDSSDGKDDFYVFFYSCDGNHGGFDCSIEIATHQGHVWSSILLIVLSAATILPAYWSLWQKTSAEWVILTSGRISSGIYPAGDANIMNFRSHFIFMAAISTSLYLATIDERFKKVIHTTVAILTALMTVINATRPSNVVLVFFDWCFLDWSI